MCLVEQWDLPRYILVDCELEIVIYEYGAVVPEVGGQVDSEDQGGDACEEQIKRVGASVWDVDQLYSRKW